jgi:preprotein translocase subunit SecG
MLETLVTVIHVAVAVTLIVVVLFQQGKGANIGATFGGSSQTMFGPRGPFQFLAKATTLIAAGFMITSISLAVMADAQRTESVIPLVDSDTGGVTEGELPTTLPDAPIETGGPVDGPVGSDADVTPPADTTGPVNATE